MNKQFEKPNPEVFLLAAEMLSESREGNLSYSPFCCDCIDEAASMSGDWGEDSIHLTLFDKLFDPTGHKGANWRIPGWWPDGDYDSRLIALCFAATIAGDEEAVQRFLGGNKKKT